MPADHAVARRYDRASISEPSRSFCAQQRHCIPVVTGSVGQLLLLLLAGTVVFELAGCAATPTFEPLSWMRPGRSAEAEEAEKSADTDKKTEVASAKDAAKKEESTAKADSEKSPWKGDDTKTASAAKPDSAPAEEKKQEAKAAEVAAKESSSETKTAASKPVHPTHDAQTLKLIEEELQDATPEERAQLFADMKGLEPHLVKQFLRVRRMVNQVHERTPAGTVQQVSARPGSTDAASSQVQHALDTRTQNAAGTGQRVAASGGGQAILDPNVQTVAGDTPGNTQGGFGHSATAQTTGQYVGGRDNGSVLTAQSDRQPVGAGRSSAVLTGIISEGENRVSAVAPANLAMTAAEVGAPEDAASGRNAGTGPGSSGDPLASSKWNDDLERLLSLTEAQITQLQSGQSEDDPAYQQYVRRHVELRLLYLMSGDRARALEAIPAIDPAHQEFWSQVLWGLANYFDSQNIPDTHDRVTQTVTQLRGAIERLQPKANLEIRNVNFCYKIASYGNYEKFDRDEFTPGQQVLVYAEVDNFTSEWSSTSQKYRTQLKSTLQLFTASGQMVKEFEFPPTEDLCQNRRRDYFHSYQVAIPRNGIGRGPHYMVLTIEDMIGRKVHDYRVNFMVK